MRRGKGYLHRIILNYSDIFRFIKRSKKKLARFLHFLIYYKEIHNKKNMVSLEISIEDLLSINNFCIPMLVTSMTLTSKRFTKITIYERERIRIFYNYLLEFEHVIVKNHL